MPDERKNETLRDNSSSQRPGLSVGPEVLPYIPSPGVMWQAFVFLIWAVLALLIVDAAVDLVVQYWFNTSLGFQTIFWTNVRAGAILFAVGGAVFAAAVYIPMRMYAVSPGLRRAAIHLSAWAWIVAGWWLSRYFQEYLLIGGSFGENDPLFGHDIGFYVFSLPFVWIVYWTLFIALLVSMASLLMARYDALTTAGILQDPQVGLLGRLSLMLNPGFNVLFYAVGFLGAVGTFLSRYDMLFWDNEPSGVRTGAEYLDVVGVFSSLNAIYLTALVEVGVTLLVGYTLYRLYNHYRSIEIPSAVSAPALQWRKPAVVFAALLALDAAFYVALVAKDAVYVSPNEPYIQKEFIQYHMDATLKGYRLEDVKAVEWIPPEEPLSPDKILASRTIKNAPILPGYVSYLEAKAPDVQQANRFEITGTSIVYGPVLEVYQQQQQLRPYYEIIDVDGVRYNLNGEKQMYVSALREIPSAGVVGPQEWLQYWGTGTLLYTHGMGLVMSPANRVNNVGEPHYTVKGIPPQASDPFFEAEPRIYYGEGAKGNYILTNIRHLKELDYATSQFRQEYVFPEDVEAGIRIDSPFKRLIFALWSFSLSGNEITAFLFSDFIDTNRTRMHLNRNPLDRVSSIVPFPFLDDGQLYAFVSEGRILWMVNALTTTDMYPYSLWEELGDKATDRSQEELQFPPRFINYAEDSIKVTIDAFTGVVNFYKIADDPIVNAWERIYPDLFKSKEMPKSVRAQLTYPLQWFHIQFDDVYKRYHQRNYIEFYNLEDLWDDADEVLGSIGIGLTAWGNQDEATFSYEGYHILLDPADLPSGAAEYLHSPDGDTQFAMLMPFTPQGAMNLRSLIIAFQDPENYGKLISLRIPQGMFLTGPEQADAVIDADARVNQQLTLWVRHGAEVMAGHTLLLPVAGDFLYIEPIFVKSTQNQVPQIKLFATVYRERVTMASSVEEAIRLHGIPPKEPFLPSPIEEVEKEIKRK